MKKKLTFLTAMLLAFSLAGCGGSSESATPEQTTPPASTATKTDTATKTSTATKTNTATKTSTATKTETSKAPTTWTKTGDGPDYSIYSKGELISYAKDMTANVEQMAYNENGGTVYKLSKGASLTWKFTLPEAKKFDFYVGAQCSYDSHLSRYLFNMDKTLNPLNPVTGEEYPDQESTSPDKATEDPWRYAVTVNGKNSPILNGKSMQENGMQVSVSESVPTDLYLTTFDLKAGENTIVLTQCNIGYRMLFSGMVRLVIKGEADPIVPVQEIKSAGIAIEEETKAIVTYNVEYEGYTFDQVKALDWQGAWQHNDNVTPGSGWGWVEWGEGKENAFTFVDKNTGLMEIKMDVTDLEPGAYTGKMGIGLIQDGGNAGHAFDIKITGVDTSIKIGDVMYSLDFDNLDDFWNCIGLIVYDASAPTWALESGAIANEAGKAVYTYTVAYTGYTYEEIVALDWQGAWQENANAGAYGGHDWNFFDYEAPKEGSTKLPLTFADLGDSKLAIKMDVTDLAINAYTGKMGIGLIPEGQQNGGHAFDARDVAGEEAEIIIGAKKYKALFGNEAFWALPGLVISENHIHSYGIHVLTRLNADGKEFSVYECSCGEREIVIDYGNGKTYKADGTEVSLQTKMDKNNHTSWHIAVDKAIEDAEIYFEGTAGSNNGRYFFNQNKAVNPVNPVTGEEYPDQPTSNPDGDGEDAWRYTYVVGEVSESNPELNPDIGVTMAEAGCGAGPVRFGKVNLAAGDNVITLFQKNAGYRLTFSGKVHIRYSGDATIVGDLENEAKMVFADDEVKLPLGEADAAHKVYAVQGLNLTEEQTFVFNVVESNEELVFDARNLKTDITTAVDAGDDAHSIKVAAAGIYDIELNLNLEDSDASVIDVVAFVPLDPDALAWNDILVSSGLDNSGKFNNPSDTVLSIPLAVAGEVTLYWTLKGSSGNGTKVMNGSSGQTFTFTVNGVAADFLGQGLTYNEYLGEDQTAEVEVAAATFEVKAGVNEVKIHAQGGYRLTLVTSAAMRLVYAE